MTNVAFPSIDDYRDIESLNMYREFVGRRGVEPERVRAMIHAKSRDNARTPMRWDNGPHAGFTTGEPRIAVNPTYREINVSAAVADPDTVFHCYRRLIALRKPRPVIVQGSYELVEDTDPRVYAFARTTPDDRRLVILSFGGGWPAIALPMELEGSAAELVIANYAQPATVDSSAITLRPWEAQVHRLY